MHRLSRDLRIWCSLREDRFAGEDIQVSEARAFGLVLAFPFVADGQSAGSGADPEVQRVVGAFLGHWDLTGTLAAPNSKTSALTVTIDCDVAAVGTVVRCRTASDERGGTHVELATIIGYSPDDHLVHLMEASSSGSFHEHVRSECFDWLLILNERHLEHVLADFVAHSDGHRPHRAVGFKPPHPTHSSVAPVAEQEMGVERRDRLGGLVHEYVLAAWTGFSHPTALPARHFALSNSAL